MSDHATNSPVWCLEPREKKNVQCIAFKIKGLQIFLIIVGHLHGKQLSTIKIPEQFNFRLRNLDACATSSFYSERILFSEKLGCRQIERAIIRWIYLQAHVTRK